MLTSDWLDFLFEIDIFLNLPGDKTLSSMVTTSVRRIFKRGGRKFENNKDQKKGLHLEIVRFSAQILVKTKKKKKGLHLNAAHFSPQIFCPNSK